jgi:ribosomal protein S18 acetylase RimI-like enzyme
MPCSVALTHDAGLVYGALMPEAANYVAHERQRRGSLIEIRSLRPEDEPGLRAAIGRASAQSMRRRFFSAKREFSEKERSFFMKIDFRNHVALVALAQDEDQSLIVGGGRYIVAAEPGRAEMAFLVFDEWQGQGIGSILLRHLIKIARNAGLRELTAEVLCENTAMLKVFTKFNFKRVSQPDPQTIHLVLPL